MAIPCSLDPLGIQDQNYVKPNTVVFDSNGGAPVTMKLMRGVYFIEAIGGGGGPHTVSLVLEWDRAVVLVGVSVAITGFLEGSIT